MSFAPQAPATYQDTGMSATSQQQQQQQQQYAPTSSAAGHPLLPEALQRFCLVGKVAVVTGFVPLPYLLFPSPLSRRPCTWGWIGLGWDTNGAVSLIGRSSILLVVREV